MRACPSYEPVASAEPLWFQSSVVTSLLLPSPLSCDRCCNTYGSLICALCALPEGPSGTRQIRAVASPDPLASSRDDGFHAQMKTSPSWPASVVTSSSVVMSSRAPPPLLLLPSSALAPPRELPAPLLLSFSDLCFLAGGPSDGLALPAVPSEARSSEKGSLEPATDPSSATLRSNS